ncbi:hypothetical protein ACEPAF_1076 [Sanghuangporus sanghuang]
MSTMDASFVQGLHTLLVQLTKADTVALKTATAQLNKEYYKNPSCIPALSSILASAPEESVRQLAAVELRKRISQKSGELWINVSQTEREEIKSRLPEITLREPSKLTRHAEARVIAAIAAIELPLQQWNDLLPLINRCCTSPQVQERELGIFLLFTVLESIVEGFSQHVRELFNLLQQLLQDPESAEVRVTAVRALGVLAQYIDAEEKDQIRAFQQLLPAMITVLQHCLDTGDEASARHLFDVFETLLILEVPLLSKHIPQLVQFFLQCGANRSYDEELRIMALNALSWTVKYKKSKLQAAGLAPAILEGLMPITTEPEPEDADDDAPSRSALRIVDALATSLPPAQVFPALRQLITQYVSQPDPNARRGALLALGVAVEGVSEFMGPHVESAIWPVVDAGLADPDPGVRRAACTAVGCICEWLEDAASSRHAVLVPALMHLVADPVTQRTACSALDALLEILGDAIGNYLQLLMENLSGLLDTAPLKVKAVVTGAIGSAAHASQSAFLPYFPSTMQRLVPFLQLSGEGEESELRGIAMDAVGTFAEAVGKDAFRPYFPDMMAQAFAAVQSDSARLRECSFLFFGVMSRVFGEEFAPYLPQVVPALINSLGQQEHGETELQSLPEAAEAFATGTSAASAIAVTDKETSGDIDDAESIDAEKMLEVNSAIAVEKEIAADTIGTVFSATGSHFLPYVEQSALELVAQLPHYYEGIRKSATESLLEILRTFYTLSDPPEWQPGLQTKVPLHSNVKDLINHVLPALLDMYETEDDKTVASALCVGLAETINTIGPGFLEDRVDEVSNIAIQILEQKALCQQDPDQDEDEEPLDDQAEYDSVLISSAGDLVAALANALGDDFTRAFQTFFPLISKFYRKGRSLSDRSSAIGSLAEIISGLKSAVTPSTEVLFNLLFQALQDEDAEVYSNAAFAIGLLVEHSGHDLSPHFGAILTALRPLFNVESNAPSSKLAARDNAAGAVSRLIVRNTAAIPLDHVLPVLIGSLPLRNDFLENRPVFRAIFRLFRTQPTVVAPYTDQLLPVFAHVLDPSGPDQLGDETRGELINLVRALSAEDPGKIQAAGLAAYPFAFFGSTPMPEPLISYFIYFVGMTSSFLERLQMFVAPPRMVRIPEGIVKRSTYGNNTLFVPKDIEAYIPRVCIVQDSFVIQWFPKKVGCCISKLALSEETSLQRKEEEPPGFDVHQVRVRGAGISTITLSTVIQNLRIKTRKSPMTVDDLSRTNRRITIVHPHTYGEESCFTPEVVRSIADALESIPSLPVPNVVIAAGYEASRVRSLARPRMGDNDADIGLPATDQDEESNRRRTYVVNHKSADIPTLIILRISEAQADQHCHVFKPATDSDILPSQESVLAKIRDDLETSHYSDAPSATQLVARKVRGKG